MSENSDCSSKDPQIVFLVGAPRSGTKLLRHLLDQNPKISMTTNETEFLPYLIRYVEDGGFNRPEGFQRFVKYLAYEDYFAHRKSEGYGETDFDAWHARCQGYSVSEVFSAFLIGDVDGADNASILGDKSPGYVRILPQILKEFPNAKILHIMRDPRSQVGSLRTTFGKPIRESAVAWCNAVDQVENLRNTCGDRILQLRYEDLTEVPEFWLRRICQFLRVPYHTDMLKVDKELERARPGNKPKRLRKAELKAYEHYLSLNEVKLVEAICKYAMVRNGYAPSGDAPVPAQISPLKARLSRSSGHVHLAILTVKRHGWAALIRKLRLARARRRILAGRW